MSLNFLLAIWLTRRNRVKGGGITEPILYLMGWLLHALGWNLSSINDEKCGDVSGDMVCWGEDGLNIRL